MSKVLSTICVYVKLEIHSEETQKSLELETKIDLHSGAVKFRMNKLRGWTEDEEEKLRAFEKNLPVQDSFEWTYLFEVYLRVKYLLNTKETKSLLQK